MAPRDVGARQDDPFDVEAWANEARVDEVRDFADACAEDLRGLPGADDLRRVLAAVFGPSARLEHVIWREVDEAGRPALVLTRRRFVDTAVDGLASVRERVAGGRHDEAARGLLEVLEVLEAVARGDDEWLTDHLGEDVDARPIALATDAEFDSVKILTEERRDRDGRWGQWGWNVVVPSRAAVACRTTRAGRTRARRREHRGRHRARAPGRRRAEDPEPDLALLLRSAP
jgi:hypothetical protein